MVRRELLISVQSNMLEMIGYDELKKEFYAKFPKSRDLYIYPTVDAYTAERVKRGDWRSKNGKYPSIGAAFTKFIKNPKGSNYRKISNFF